MNDRILRRLERLEKIVPAQLIVEYCKGDSVYRKSMKDFCRECRTDGKVYKFKVVDGTKMDDIDMLIQLIDELAKDEI